MVDQSKEHLLLNSMNMDLVGLEKILVSGENEADKTEVEAHIKEIMLERKLRIFSSHYDAGDPSPFLEVSKSISTRELSAVIERITEQFGGTPT